MQTHRTRLSPRIVGLFFLIPGVIVGGWSLLQGSFQGAALGFSTFATLFGLILTFMPLKSE